MLTTQTDACSKGIKKSYLQKNLEILSFGVSIKVTDWEMAARLNDCRIQGIDTKVTQEFNQQDMLLLVAMLLPKAQERKTAAT